MNALKLAVPLFVAFAYGPSQGLAVPILSPTLASYAVLGADAPRVSCVPTCFIGGNVGSSPTGASPGSSASDFSFSSGSFQPAATATEGTAQTDLTTAIGLANAGIFTLIPSGDLDAFQTSLGGSIAPGNYQSTAIGNLVETLILAGGGRRESSVEI